MFDDRAVPDSCRPPALAAAMVVTLGHPLTVDPMWRQLAGDETRDVVDCRLRPIQFVDFYPPQGGFGSRA